MFRFKFLENIVVAILQALLPIVKNYGVAIIVTTIIIKLIMLPLSIKQEKAMLKMKELQPEIDEINRKYKGDKVKINEMTANLYRERQVNPLGGCLPIIIQLPIFIALYNAFRGDAIPDTAHFLWFNLKQPDTIFAINNIYINLIFFKITKIVINVLPLIGTALMIVQQKLMTTNQSKSNNENEQAMQTMMYTLPLFMLLIFYNMPSGINLYYAVNTLLSIILQLYVIKKVRKNG